MKIYEYWHKNFEVITEWINQYSETNMMHFLFNLLGIKGLYMFWTLLAHPQEMLHKRHITGTQYTKCNLWSASWGWASNAQNIYRPLILNNLNEKCITLVSL
jgi:hypothetical protein